MIKKAGEVLGLNPERFRMRRGSIKLIISLDKRSAERVITDTDNKVFENLDVRTVRILSKSGKVLRSRTIRKKGETSKIDEGVRITYDIIRSRELRIANNQRIRCKTGLALKKSAIKKKK